jgi:hypothetical protein
MTQELRHRIRASEQFRRYSPGCIMEFGGRTWPRVTARSCAGHTRDGAGNLCDEPAVPAPPAGGIIEMPEVGELSGDTHEHYDGPKYAWFHLI